MEWINKVYYNDMTDEDMEHNVAYIWNFLSPRGWTANAVAGVCGCLQGESRFDPWAWQGNKFQGPNSTVRTGYGLPQWTPFTKYTQDALARSFPGFGPAYSGNPGSENDGDAQLLWLDAGKGGYYKKPQCPLTFSEYKASTEEPEYLAAGWVYNYERPKDTAGAAERVKPRGRRWYDYILALSPPDPNDKIVSVRTQPPSAGRVTGGGVFHAGDVTTLLATSNSGYVFKYFQIPGKGKVFENPYTLTVSDAMTIVAYYDSTGGEGGDTPLPPFVGFRDKMPMPLYLKKHRRR